MAVSSRRIVTPRIVQHDSGNKPWLWLVLLVVVIAVSWLAFELGRKQGVVDFSRMEHALERSQAEVVRLKKEVSDLMLESATYQRSAQIDRDAAMKVKEEIRRLQNDKATLAREVAFLNGLLKDKNKKAVLRLNDLQLRARTDARSYRLAFTLVHLSKVGGTASGEVHLSVSGKQAGKSKKLGLAELTANGKKFFRMKFRNFQNFETGLQLPEGFEPETLLIEVVTSSKKLEPFKKEIDWTVAELAAEKADL